MTPDCLAGRLNGILEAPIGSRWQADTVFTSPAYVSFTYTQS